MIDRPITAYIEKLFSDLGIIVPENEKIDFLSKFNFKKIAKAHHLVEVGDSIASFGFITKGLVRFYFNTFDGKELNQTFKKETDIFMNYYPHLTGKGSPFGIQALENTEVYTAKYQDLIPFYERAPGWDRLGRKLMEQNFIIKAERERELLTLDSMGRFESFLTKFPELGERLSKHHIALYLGINPASLSRLIKSREI